MCPVYRKYLITKIDSGMRYVFFVTAFLHLVLFNRNSLIWLHPQQAILMIFYYTIYLYSLFVHAVVFCCVTVVVINFDFVSLFVSMFVFLLYTMSFLW